MTSLPLGSDEFLAAVDQAAQSAQTPILLKLEPHQIHTVAYGLRTILQTDDDELPPGLRENAAQILLGIGLTAGVLSRPPIG